MKKSIFLVLIMALGAFADDGATVYKQKCQNCHGKNGELSALGKAEPIAGWDKTKTAEALAGYQNGSRNIKGLGAVMTKGVSSLSADDINNVSEYVSTLKK